MDLPTRLSIRVTKLVEGLEHKINDDPHRARSAIRQICEEIPVRPHESGGFLVARVGLSAALLRAV
jgi:hypothetical protein